jgi:pyochelin biosynthesis protein PchG
MIPERSSDPPDVGEAMRVLVCGSGFGRIYLRALAGRPEYALVGLLGRGSERSSRLAGRYGLPLITRLEALPHADIACVALAQKDAATVVPVLLNAGMHVLMEHPVSPDALVPLLDHAFRVDRCLHVNSHFAEIAHIDRFLRHCADLARREAARWITGACSARTRFSLLDILLRLRLSAGESDRVAQLLASAALPGGFRYMVGTLGDVPFHVTETPSASAIDDGSDQQIGHRLTVAFSSEAVTLVGTWGPVVSTRPMSHDWRLAPRDPAQATVADLRDTAIREAVAAVREHARTGKPPRSQTSTHLIELARLWDQTVAVTSSGADRAGWSRLDRPR